MRLPNAAFCAVQSEDPSILHSESGFRAEDDEPVFRAKAGFVAIG
jgi:hypothetical protein